MQPHPRLQLLLLLTFATALVASLYHFDLKLGKSLHNHVDSLRRSLGAAPLSHDEIPNSEETFKEKRDGSQYLLGVGKADITGPVVQLELMGYADTSQIGTGLRQRLYARSFIIGSPTNPSDRFVYTNIDTQSGDTAVRYGVLSGLAAMGSGYSMYSQSNVAVVGTHSHSGPGAWLNYLLPDVTSLGFDNQSYQAIVDGCVLSIQRAHESLTPGTLGFGTVPLKNANINRSLYAYLANPASERAQYTDSVDKTMSVLKFTRSSDNKDIGILTWFPVHGTSLYGNNTLVTGDNKGIAADLFEKSVAGSSTAAPGFVAGFSQANVGDTSPNILGAYCPDGTLCTFKQSLCGNSTENCHGRGPNFRVPDNGQTSGLTIGTRQYQAAKSLYNSWSTSHTPIFGSSVRAYHTFQNMAFWNFTLPNGTIAQTCPGALGYGFGGGTTDWPGYFDFKQGDNSTSDANPIWVIARTAFHPPSAQQLKCQGIKPILLDVGEMHIPYEWAPTYVDIQMFRVGQLLIIVSPGEATTMSGRRWKASVAAAATKMGLTGSTPPLVVLGGPANSYTHYIATPEEYQIQRYEGASTLYGPHTLDAYMYLSNKYLPYLADTRPKKPLSPGTFPPNNVGRALSFITPPVSDIAPVGQSFGQVINDAPSSVKRGSTVNVTFVGANPRNDLNLEGTYAAIEQRSSGSSWTTYKDDSDWELVFHWNQTAQLVVGTTSETQLVWFVPGTTPKGTYRFRYNGASKALLTGIISQFTGTSRAFTVS